MRKFVFLFAVILMTAACDCESNTANSNSNSTNAATSSLTVQSPQTNEAVVFRVGKYYVGGYYGSHTVLWLDNGISYDVTDSREPAITLVHDGDTIVYYMEETKLYLVEIIPQ